jgi:hypothetical protein
VSGFSNLTDRGVDFDPHRPYQTCFILQRVADNLVAANEAAFDGNARRFGAAAGAELGKDMNQVALNCSLRGGDHQD